MLCYLWEEVTETRLEKSQGSSLQGYGSYDLLMIQWGQVHVGACVKRKTDLSNSALQTLQTRGRTSFLVRYKVPDILLNCQFLELIHNLVAIRFLFARLSFDGGRWGWMAPCLDPLGSSCQWSNRLGPLFRTNQPADWDDILGNSERFRLRTGWKNWIPPAPGGGPWVTPPPSACHRTVGWKTLYGRVLGSVGRPTWRRIKASTTLNLRNESFGMNWIQ